MSILPPGVTVSMIPGNRPEDEVWEQLFLLIGQDAEQNEMSDMDVYVAWHLGLAAFLEHKKLGGKWPHDAKG